MNSPVTEMTQCAAIMFWGVMMLFVIIRVGKLNARMDRWAHTADALERMEVKDPEPVCGCKHHQCFHDENGCGKIEARAVYSTGPTSITRAVDRDVPCDCKRYTGPEPLPTVIP